MSGRLDELLTNPGMGHGREMMPFLFPKEARGIRAVNPESSRMVPRHRFYDAIAFRKDALDYARHYRAYMSDVNEIALPPLWLTSMDELERVYPDHLRRYEKKANEHQLLVREYTALVNKYENVPHDSVVAFSNIRPPPPAPNAPELPSEDDMPPPLALTRARNTNAVEWWDQWLQDEYQGKRSVRRRGSRRSSDKPKPVNQSLYERIKKSKCKQFKNPSLTRSRCLVREYVRSGGKYKGNRKNSTLTVGFKRWNKSHSKK